jgi:hypothetical protein
LFADKRLQHGVGQRQDARCEESQTALRDKESDVRGRACSSDEDLREKSSRKKATAKKVVARKSTAKKTLSAKAPAGKAASKRTTATGTRVGRSAAQANIAAPDTSNADALATLPPAQSSGAEATA